MLTLPVGGLCRLSFSLLQLPDICFEPVVKEVDTLTSKQVRCPLTSALTRMSGSTSVTHCSLATVSPQTFSNPAPI